MEILFDVITDNVKSKHSRPELGQNEAFQSP